VTGQAKFLVYSCTYVSRDVVVTKKVWEHTQKTSHFKTASFLKQLQTHFKAKLEKV